MRWLILTLLAAGCALVEGRDYRIDHARRIIYGRTSTIVHNICNMRGGATPVGARSIAGCYDPNDGARVLLDPEGRVDLSDPVPGVEAHEDKHRREGAWHQ